MGNTKLHNSKPTLKPSMYKYNQSMTFDLPHPQLRNRNRAQLAFLMVANRNRNPTRDFII